MAFLKAFGSYLPSRVVKNDEIGTQVGCDAAWIRNVSGIDERRFAAPEETLVDMAAQAAHDCLARAGLAVAEVGMLLVSTGTSGRQFPGPACSVAHRLGLVDVPALDVPMASAGSLWGLSLASRLAAEYQHVLVVAAERMSDIVQRQPMERGISILFGDGAGACLVSADSGMARVIDSSLHSDGAYADDLHLTGQCPLQMNGRSVILQASRKIPRAIQELLERHGRAPGDVDAFVMHQANQNLIDRVADALGVASERFFSNIRQYGNTSSASMLIAAKEWVEENGFEPGSVVCFAGFGAGFHWGALLAEGV